MKLNIGCGTNLFPTPWLNVDKTNVEHDYIRHLRNVEPKDVESWPEEQRALVKSIADDRIRFFQWDMRKGFPMYPDESIDAIYLGQVVEHLNPIYELPKVLRECRRLLVPGGMVRITTPDLENLLMAYEDGELAAFKDEQPEFYAKASDPMRLSMLLFGSSGPECTSENYEGHFVCFTGYSLSDALQAAGLVPERLDNPSETFRDCIDKGMSHSLGMEARK